MGRARGIRSGEASPASQKQARNRGREKVGVEKRISPPRCSQNSRAASVEMTISWSGRRGQATATAGPSTAALTIVPCSFAEDDGLFFVRTISQF
jgi:hypothetical protein